MTSAWPPSRNSPSLHWGFLSLQRPASSLQAVRLWLLINSLSARRLARTLCCWEAWRLLVRRINTLAWVSGKFSFSDNRVLNNFLCLAQVLTSTRNLIQFPRAANSNKVVVADSRGVSKCNAAWSRNFMHLESLSISSCLDSTYWYLAIRKKQHSQRPASEYDIQATVYWKLL